MSQHDYNVANASGAAIRADFNSALGAIVTWNAGASAPSPTFPNMRWFDTSTGRVWLRDNANTAWLPWFGLDASGQCTLDADADDVNLLQLKNATGNVVASLRVDSGGTGRLVLENASSAIKAELVGSNEGSLYLGGSQSTGRKVVAPELIDETTITSDTAQYVATWDNTLDYKLIKVLVSRLRPATADDILILRTSSNGGSTYDSGASDYAWGRTRINIGGSGDSEDDAADSEIQLTGTNNIESTDGNTGTFEIDIVDPGNASSDTTAFFRGMYLSSGGNRAVIHGSGMRLAEADVDGLRLAFAAQSIAEAQVRVLGYR